MPKEQHTYLPTGTKKPNRANDKNRLPNLVIIERFGMQQIRALLIEGRSLMSIAKELDVPYVVLWDFCNDPDYVEIYRAAVKAQAHAFAGGVMDVANEKARTRVDGSVDTGDISHKKLRIDTMKWIAAKRDPSYSEKLVLEQEAKELSQEQIDARIEHLLAVSKIKARQLAADSTTDED